MRNPLNADKRESSFQFLCRVFRKDQTYSDLVDELESYGLVFDRKALTQCLLFAVRASNIGDQTCLDQTTPAGALSEPARGLATTTAVPFSDRPNPVSIPKMRNTSASSHTEQSAAAAALANHGVAEPSITAPSSNNAVSATTIGAEQESSIQIRSILPQGQVLRPSPDSDERSKKRYRSTIEIMDSTQPRSDEDNMMVSPSKQPRLENPTGQAPNRHSPVLAIVESLARTAESPLSSPPAHLGPGNRNSKSEEGHERGDSPEVSHIRNRKDIAQALRPSDVLPERVSYNADTIARDILRAAGHHPTEAPLNHHLKELRENFSAVNTQTDLETFRWDLVDSDGPPAPRLEDIKVDLSPLIKPRRHDRDDGISGDSVQETPMDALDATAPMSPLTNYFSARYQSRQTTPAHDVAWPGAGPSVATPRSDRSPESEHGSSLHFTPSNGPKEAGEDILPHPQSSPVPEFPIYVCEWEGCQAELHDAHTLRRHVRKCHLKNQTSCLWADCPRSMKRFQPDELREHVQAAHIQPQVSKYGNGPTFPGNGDGMAPYLRDEDGAIITPDVATAREHDTIIFPANETAIEAYHELHGHYSDLERARQVFEAVQRQRRKIGFGLEREGCIFATPERNRVLDDQEDVFEVVPCPIED
ncbi:hypothetical protein VTN31DRAFT_3329 [Thermomyces dupontii]|uniref:uncharacterized protein n=1 Tax=Talaromyces thermophilus TaxID=28565 RepID=UPI003744787C